MKILLLGIFLFMAGGLGVAGQIDLSKIAVIESNSRLNAIGDNGQSFGLYQIHRRGILADFNQMTGADVKPSELFSESKSAHIALWAFEERLPQLIRARGHKVTERALIIAWNCGTSCLDRKALPKTTVNYLKKYRSLK